MTLAESTVRVDAPANVTRDDRCPRYGSDVMLDVLRALGFEYMAVMPGSTTRGLHDSAVNYTGNRAPELLLCNHEMATVSMARGYARATGRPMAALIHNVVGLLNTSMTIYDAWCDRVPVVVIGGTGPVDSTRRRPSIDWRHTANIQGNAVRDFTKWDDQPGSVGAAVEALLRAHRIAVTEPAGPTYVCLDVDLQEEELTDPVTVPDVGRYSPARSMAPDPEALRETARWLVEAELPLVFADRLGRSADAVGVLVELADEFAVPVVDMGERCNFPTPHTFNFSGMAGELVPDADVVLGLDAPNLFGALRAKSNWTTRETQNLASPDQRVATISVDELAHRGWQADYHALPAVDLPLLGDTALAMPQLLDECRRQLDPAARARIDRRRSGLADRQQTLRRRKREYLADQWAHPQITEARLLAELWEQLRAKDVVFTSAKLEQMAPGVVELTGPRQYVGGGSGGGAVGATPGVALGAALALRDTGCLPVAVLGDGSLFASIQVLWTAAHYRIPSLWVVNNNRSYYNDENHQIRISEHRGRPVENAWISQRLERPEVDFASITRQFGLYGEGPIKKADDLAGAFRRGIEAAARGELAVVDVWTENRQPR